MTGSIPESRALGLPGEKSDPLWQMGGSSLWDLLKGRRPSTQGKTQDEEGMPSVVRGDSGHWASGGEADRSGCSISASPTQSPPPPHP